MGLGGKEVVSSGGVASGAFLTGGLQYVLQSGTAVGTTVSAGAKEVISFGGVVSGLSLASGGEAIDTGEILMSGATTWAGVIEGDGTIVETGAGDLLVSGKAVNFNGEALISGGTMELGTANALGGGYVHFAAPSTGSAVLQIDAADAPAAGGTFANIIDDFSAAHEYIDLRSIAYVAGASAEIVGADLVLTDGANTYSFNIAGSVANAYPVLSDGHGGVLIDPVALGPKLVAFAQAAAAFAPSSPARAALVSSTSPGGLTPFVHAVGSGGAAHV